MPLSVNVTQKNPGVYQISPIGSVDSNTSPILEKEVDAVLNLVPQMIVFDMGGVTFLSSAGVRVVFKTEKALKQKGSTFTMVNLQPQIKKVFDIINALPSLTVFSSVQELDSYLARMQQKGPAQGNPF